MLQPKFTEAGIKLNDTPFPLNEKFRSTRLPTSKLLPLDILKGIQTSCKIADRQFARQLEMYLLSRIGFSHRASGGASLTKLLIHKHKSTNPDDRAYYWWRLLVKQRITKKNRDLLQQLDLADRYPQVEDSLRGQEDEYEGMLLLYALKENDAQRNGNGIGKEPSRERKRKIVEDDEDDDSDIGSEPKKMKA